MAASCRGDAPISWVPATHCRTSPSPCGEGDLRIVLNGSAVPLCGPANTSLRHFNRTMKHNCLQKLAQSRKQTNASSSPNSSFSPYRLLFTGVSNMFHTWHGRSSKGELCENNARACFTLALKLQLHKRSLVLAATAAQHVPIIGPSSDDTCNATQRNATTTTTT
jgi:hypothetical protein